MVRGEHQFGGRWARLKAQVLACLVMALRRTWRVRYDRPELFADAVDRGGAVIAFWHGEQLPLVPIHANGRVAGLASLSRDGSLLAGVISRLGYTVVRGSSSRGGRKAFDECLSAIGLDLSPALALDGPRGPRHRVHTGAVRLSKQTGAPIILLASHVQRAVRLKSWDGFQIPLPGARVDVAYACISPDEIASATVEEGCRHLRAQMLALGARVRTGLCAPLAD